MVPGYEITKDPKVTVKKGSEACWLFVKVEKENNFDNYMTYEIAESWTAGDGTNIPSDVIYRRVETNGIGTAYSILKGDKVIVKGEVTKVMMTTAETSKPTLSFTAYACQLMKNNTEEFIADEAWQQVAPKN